MATVRNKQTGMILTIPDDQVSRMTSQWEVYTPQATTTAPSSGAVGGLTSVQAPASSTVPASSTTPAASSPTASWSAILKQGEGQYIVIAGSQVIGSYADPNQAISVAKSYGPSYIGTFSGSQFPTAASVADWVKTNRPEAYAANPAPAPATPAAGAEEADQTTEGGLLDASNVPDEITSSEEWKGLSDSEKNLVTVVYNGIVSGNAATAADAQKYLQQAKELADPYYRSLTNVALDELERVGKTAVADLDYKFRQIDTKISELQSDLTYNREKLTLDEQAEMSSLLREYEQEKEDLDLQMQEAGLTFSSPRKKAEERLMTAQDETAQSVRRKYAASEREQALTASRTQAQLQQERELAERQTQENITSAARTTESKVGSANLPSTAGGQGITPLGGVTGSIEDTRKQAILDLEAIIKGRQGALPTF